MASDQSRVKGIDPLTHWLRPGDPDEDPDVTWIKAIFKT